MRRSPFVCSFVNSTKEVIFLPLCLFVSRITKKLSTNFDEIYCGSGMYMYVSATTGQILVVIWIAMRMQEFLTEVLPLTDKGSCTFPDNSRNCRRILMTS